MAWLDTIYWYDVYMKLFIYLNCGCRSKWRRIFIYTSYHFTLHGRYELNKLTSLPMCGFIAQLVELPTGIAKVTGSNPVEALIFSGFFFPIASTRKFTAMIILHFDRSYCLNKAWGKWKSVFSLNFLNMHAPKKIIRVRNEPAPWLNS